MKLLFIWVQDFNSLRNVQMNFSELESYEYNENKISLVKRCISPDNTIFPIENIHNISVLVGSNGSGKSSINDILFQILFNGAGEYIPHVLILEINGKHVISYSDPSLEIDENIGEYEVYDEWSKNHFSYIYYSPYYTCRVNASSLMNGQNEYYNISTEQKLISDIEQYKNEKSFIEYNSNITQVEANRILDFERCISFFTCLQNRDQGSFKLNITYPLNIGFHTDSNELNFLESELEDFDYLKTIFINLKNSRRRVIDKASFIENLMFFCFSNFIRGNLLSSQVGIADEIRNEYITRLENVYDEQADNKTNLERIFDSFKSEKSITDLPYTLNSTARVISEIINFIRFVEKFPDSYFHDYELTLPVRDKEIVNRFYYYYKNSRSLTEYGNFYFEPFISAGEFAEILLYARLYETLNQIIKDHTKNIFLFLDEVEVSLHPKLQQEIVQNIIYFFQDFYKDKIEVQIVFATHSPIILSDIPPSNVIYLKKEIGEKNSYVFNPTKKMAFASNIFDLYKNSFFLDDTNIGAFARNLINNAIKEVEDYKAGRIESVSEKSKNIIDIISDPILKRIIKENSEE